MFVFLSKLLPQFFYPIPLVCFILIFSILLNHKTRLRNFVVVVAIIILLVAGNRWVALSIAQSLEWRYQPAETIPSAEVIVVLGGATEPAESPRSGVEVNDAADRMIYAAKLYHQNKAPIILLSGGSIAWEERKSSPAEEMAEIMEMLGVAKKDMWLDLDSRNTYENALFAHRILEKKGVKRIILVTSAMHMPRSAGLFIHQGFDVIPAPTDYSVTEKDWRDFSEGKIEKKILSLFPSASYLSMTTNALKEYLGMMIYHFQGWM
jgi:uncharacterized SAM-binding protein YcdF (DUF218 family)